MELNIKGKACFLKMARVLFFQVGEIFGKLVVQEERKVNRGISMTRRSCCWECVCLFVS